MKNKFIFIIILLIISGIGLCYYIIKNQSKVIHTPEGNTGRYPKKLIKGKDFMVVTANPYASQIGKKILKQGGNVIDAMVAIQLALTLVEPQSSGIGGGAFVLYWDAKKNKLLTYDARETAPLTSNMELFLDKNKQPLKWKNVFHGGRAVGTPGVIALFEKLHKKHGKLPWAMLFEDVIALSERGFLVSHRLHSMLKSKFSFHVKKYKAAYYYFYPNKIPVPIGYQLKNPRLAQTLKAIQQYGSQVFYKGYIAKNIVQTVKKHNGLLSLKDLSSYKIKERNALCAPYRKYHICGMGPPTSGGLTTLQILGTLEHTPFHTFPPESPKAFHFFLEASKLSYADRAAFIGDSDFLNTPMLKLIHRDYLKTRSRLISHHSSMGKATSGFFNPKKQTFQTKPFEKNHTTHFSIVDSYGNALSMTSSIEMAFGSGLMVDGFLLNNQLTDFNFEPKKNGKLVANRVQPKKRPRSSMSPTIVFYKKKPYLLIGSPGGSRIISYVAKTLVAVLDWKYNLQDAIDSIHVINQNHITEIESSFKKTTWLKKELKDLNHKVRINDLNSGLHGILILDDNTLHGAADSRREGLALTLKD